MAHDDAPSPHQIRAARRLLGWNTYQLAVQSGVGQQIVAVYEATGRVMAPSSLTDDADRLAAIVTTLEAAGCEFAADPLTGHPSVRLRERAAAASGRPEAPDPA